MQQLHQYLASLHQSGLDGQPTSALTASNFSLKVLIVQEFWSVAGTPTAARNLQQQTLPIVIKT